MKDRKISRDDVKIRTYDRVQGDEANVVIIDTSATKCTDLNTNRNRGNVVLSRARDMIILLATNEFIRKVNPLIPRVRFWGRWIAQPKLRYIKDEENARTAVRELKVLIHDIDTNPRNVGDQHKRVGHGVKCARKYAIDRDGVALTDIGTAILLKGSYWLNHWRNKVLYRAFVECETDTIIDDVINLCAKDIPWREKYAGSFKLLGIKEEDSVDEKTEQLVRLQYKVHERPTRRNKGSQRHHDNTSSRYQTRNHRREDDSRDSHSRGYVPRYSRSRRDYRRGGHSDNSGDDRHQPRGDRQSDRRKRRR